ncbi:MAG: hypothetical protein HRU36_05625 [Rickettsiales bacterium]|nr:hypothetical protein [Rickettsiales bacterium]
MLHDQQYSLDLKFPISFREEDYIVTNSNYLAWKFIKKWPIWGSNNLSNIACIYGESSSGKSHLASIWQKFSIAQKISKQHLLENNFLRNANLIIDDIEKFIEYEQALFNLFNHMAETKNSLLITAKKSLSKLEVKLPDLHSRLSSVFSIEIARPDNKMIESIITKYFSDMQITLHTKVIKFLVNRINRSYAEISTILKKLDKISLSEKRKISIPFIKEVLSDVTKLGF